MLSRSAAAVGHRRVRRGFFISAVAVLLATLLMGMTSVEPTQASWTDEESAGSSLRAGVVPSPSEVDCEFPPDWRGWVRNSFSNLRIDWEAPEADGLTIQPERYRLDLFEAAEHTRFASIEIGKGFSYADFSGHFDDPDLPWRGSDVNTYHIHVIAIRGNWESEPWVLEAWVSGRRTFGIPDRDSYCGPVNGPEAGGGAVTFTEDSGEGPLDAEFDEEMVEEELLEQEFDAEKDPSAETTFPTEEAPGPAEESPSPVEEQPQEPGEPSETDEPDETAPSAPDSPTPSSEGSRAPSPEETVTETPTETHEGSASETPEN